MIDAQMTKLATGGRGWVADKGEGEGEGGAEAAESKPNSRVRGYEETLWPERERGSDWRNKTACVTATGGD